MKNRNNFSGNANINYLSKDFNSFKSNLVDFAKAYYPNTYKDFSEGSTGMMFIELASYVGDVLSYYTDFQFNESFLVNATERKNILNAAKFLGYKPKLTRPAFCSLDVYQIIPSVRNELGEFVPNYRYAITIQEGMVVANSDNIAFTTETAVDFTPESSDPNMEVTVHSRTSDGEIESFLLKKNVPVKSAEIITETFNVSDAQEFLRINISRDDVIDIVSVVDSDGNRWNEVDFLAQDIVFTETQNISSNEKDFHRFKDSVPYILGSLKTSRKFTTGVDENGLYLEFGSGLNASALDEDINSIKSATVYQGKANLSINPAAFLKGREYGLMPENTVLTVKYTAGGGIQANLASNELTNIVKIESLPQLDRLPSEERTIFQQIKNSIAVTNPDPASGGKDAESVEEIRYNSLLHFNSQNRVVSTEDYLTRIMSMPSKYGSIAKVDISSEDEITNNSFSYVKSDKSFGVNVYVLAYDSNGNFADPNPALIHNISEYIRRNRMLTDEISIRPGLIINIGVDFEIIAYKGENKKEVLTECLDTVKSYFANENMEFNTPINLNELRLVLLGVNGVQSVGDIDITNLTIANGDYSPNKYSIQTAYKNGFIYPSLDPSVFEVKYPNKDITGKCL